jgi:O-antigen/teichoic acid export membrane protein
VTFPLVTTGIVLRGAFEGGRRFDVANMIRIPMALASYLGPVVALNWRPDAQVAAAVVCGVRGVYLIAQLGWLDRLGPQVHHPQGPDRASAHALLHIGGWIAVSAICVPILVQGDRLVLPFMAPIVAFGWYATVAEAVMRIWMISSVMQPVVLGALATAQVRDPERLSQLLRTAVHATGAVLAIPLAVLLILRSSLLPSWLGPAYVGEAEGIVVIVSLGVFAGGFAQLTYAVLQAAGRGAPVAWTHLLEVPVVLTALIAVAPRWGVSGVAWVFTLRLVVDAVVLGLWSARTLPYAVAAAKRGGLWLAVGLSALSVIARLS